MTELNFMNSEAELLIMYFLAICCLPWRNIYLDLLPIFHWVVLFLILRYKSLILMKLKWKNGSLSNLWGCLTQCFSHWPSCSWVLLRLSPRGFLGSPSGKEPACQCRRYVRHGFDPWVGKIPGGGHGNQLQYSCLGNSIDRGAWKATVHRVTESDMTEVT